MSSRIFLAAAVLTLSACTEPRIHPAAGGVTTAPQDPHPFIPAGQPQIAADAHAARLALLAMIDASGNRWMAEDLNTRPITRDGDVYRIGRWQFSLEKMTFSFTHTNRNITPPILFNISGILERAPAGKFTARVTGRQQS